MSDDTSSEDRHLDSEMTLSEKEWKSNNEDNTSNEDFSDNQDLAVDANGGFQMEERRDCRWMIGRLFLRFTDNHHN